MANPGWLSGAGVWSGTEAGSVGDGTGTGKTNVNPLTIKTIVFVPATANDVATLKDGTDTDTLLTFNIYDPIITFGEGKTFPQGLYLSAITSGAKMFIYPK